MAKEKITLYGIEIILPSGKRGFYSPKPQKDKVGFFENPFYAHWWKSLKVAQNACSRLEDACDDETKYQVVSMSNGTIRKVV